MPFEKYNTPSPPTIIPPPPPPQPDEPSQPEATRDCAGAALSSAPSLDAPNLSDAAVSHRWSSDAAKEQPLSVARPHDQPGVEFLKLLQAGKPVPAGPRIPPAEAPRAWDASAAPRRVLTEVAGDASLSDRQPAGRPLRVLVLFAGPGETESHLPMHLRAAGCEVVAVDTKLGGSAHDVLRTAVGQPIIYQLQGGLFDAAFIATPCSSYSVRHDPHTAIQHRARGYPAHT